MSLLSLKFLKSLIAVLCLSMIFWSAVSAQSLVLCLGENGHAEIESVLNSCCLEQQATLNANETSMQALDSGACGNCTDIPLSFYFHQSSSVHGFELPIISNQAAMPTTLLSSDNISFRYQNIQDQTTPDIVLHSHLERITVLRV